MPELTEHVIDGAMFLRNCSREKAIEWLDGPATEEEVAEEMRDGSLSARLAKELGFTTDQIRSFVRHKRRWDAESARFCDAVRRSRIITAEDLAVTINARDYD